MEQRLITKEQIAMHTCIKNFAWEDQSRKQCYIFHIALRGVNSAIIELETHKLNLLFSLFILMDKAVNSRKQWERMILTHISRKVGKIWMLHGGTNLLR